MSAKHESRREVRKRRQMAHKRWALALSSILVLALLVAAGLLWADRQRALAAFDYGPQDVSHEQPMRAVHQMAGDQGKPPLSRSGPQPKVRPSDTFHDFGIVSSTAVVSRDFVIANTGEAPLVIRSAYTTCGCTTASFTASVIPPGMVSIVTIAFDAGFHDLSGQTVRRGLIMDTNDPDNPAPEIWIQATVR